MKEKPKYVFILGSVTDTLVDHILLMNERYSASRLLFYVPMGHGVKKIVPRMRNLENICYSEKHHWFRNRFFELKTYYSAERLVLHGLFCGLTPLLPLLVLLVLFPRKMSKKLAWVEHGGDLYNWKAVKNNLSGTVADWINRKIRESAAMVGLCHPMDEGFLREEFHSGAPCFYTQLRSSADPFSLWESTRPGKAKPPDAPVLIQVGHNAFQFNHHIHILDMMEQFRDENLRLVLPMAYGVTGIFGDIYGGRDYCNAVVQMAKSIFEDKARLFSRMIPRRAFMRYLWTVDIAVFDLYRSAALGNLHALFYMNKKIFLPSGSILYDWMKEQGLEIYDTNQIGTMSYEQFIAPPVSQVNHDWVVRFLNENTIATWDAFFDALDRSADGKG